MTQEATSRRRGRELEAAIFEAAQAELQEVGFQRLTMDGVARRAGTSKPVLYRRWPKRTDLVVATVIHFMPTVENVPDAGSLRGNTISVLEILRERMFTVGRTTMVGLLTELAGNPEDYAEIYEAATGTMKKIMNEGAFDRAIASGEITGDQLTERLMTLPIELARMEFLIYGTLTDQSIEDIVDTVFLPALAARAR